MKNRTGEKFEKRVVADLKYRGITVSPNLFVWENTSTWGLPDFRCKCGNNEEFYVECKQGINFHFTRNQKEKFREMIKNGKKIYLAYSLLYDEKESQDIPIAYHLLTIPDLFRSTLFRKLIKKSIEKQDDLAIIGEQVCN